MPKIDLEDTIAAVATPIGEGGVSMIRLSGSDSRRILSRCFVPKKGMFETFTTHTLHYGEIRDEDGSIIDQVIVGLFLAPNSYTGQDVFEVSAHGGLVVTRKILDRLIHLGARHAEPGEFTKRAFLNGKMDLTQAEAVLDLIKAKSDRSAEVALHQLKGGLSSEFKRLRDDLMKILAHLEAYVDFPDEHLEVYENKDFKSKFVDLERKMDQMLDGFSRGVLIREGLSIILVGKPNVGKSSLFNALLERDRAIVSEFPGTTRDVIEEAIQIKGLYARLLDTAGLHLRTQNPLDQMGMEKTKSILTQGNVFLYLVDGSQVLEKADQEVFKDIVDMGARDRMLVVINKMDLPEKLDRGALDKWTDGVEKVYVSTLTREGMQELTNKIGKKIESLTGQIEQDGEQITRLRHKNALEQALAHLKNARLALEDRKSLEFSAYDLKSALDQLRELIGEIYSEDLLDVIFAEFCIGK